MPIVAYYLTHTSGSDRYRYPLVSLMWFRKHQEHMPQLVKAAHLPLLPGWPGILK